MARLLSVVAAFAVALMLAVGVGPAYAVHDNGMFELDGNTVQNDATPPPYDWEGLFNGTGGQIVTPDPDNGPVLASTFIKDTTTPDASYFESNKDIEPIPAWGCGPINNPENKDDLQNTYAALMLDGDGHKVLYMGSERDTNNGTSFAGFWLLKDKSVGCNSPGTFTGGHTNGDILVVSDYTNGGGTQDVSVYKWIGGNTTNSTTANLQKIASGGVCGSAANDDVCAIANADTITTPWAPTSHAKNTFVETGIDLDNVLGSGGCFTTFLAETRSSAELTATLKDYAGGQFDTCPPAPLTTVASGNSADQALGSAQTDTATLTAVGNRPIPSGTVDFYLCQPGDVTAGGCEGTAGDLVSTETVDGTGHATSDSTSDTNVTGTYCWRAEYTPDTTGANNYVASSHTNHGNECFTVIKASPTITTQINVTGAGLGFTTLGDTATLHGYAGDVSGETVTFKLYGPYASGVTPDCSVDDVIAGATTTGALNGANPAQATTSSTYEPTVAGTYIWIASYPGDALNNPVSGTCAEVGTESTTISAATVVVSKTANPGGPVSAGDEIGFDITVANHDASVPAADVHVEDPLPAGADGVADGDLHWTLDAYTGCSISGADGQQVLTCDLGTVDPSTTLDPIHIRAGTTPADCGVVSNTATVSTSNGGGNSDSASVTVRCPAVTFTKTADAASVTAGGQIGFTITATNSSAAGTGTAHDVVINDPLPAGNGIDWSIASGPGTCSIAGAPPTETLHCTAVDLAPGASETVHLVSATNSVTSCATYPNVASLTASNAPGQTANATTQVVNCVVVSPPIQQPHPHVLPNTGGPDMWVLAGGMALLLGGAGLVLTDQRRKRRS